MFLTEPVPLALVTLSALIYGGGLRRLWREAGRGRGVGQWRAACFAAGLAALLVALCSPLDRLAESLFAAHMAQHLLLVVVAAPLLVLGAPLLPMLWALPPGARRRLGRWWAAAPLGDAWRVISRPLPAWLLSAAALWIWHLPAAYQAALGDPRLHAAEHLSFLMSSCLFWWVALPGPGRRHLQPGADVLYVFTAGVQAGLLGALITLAAHPLYFAQSGAAAGWGLTPLDDQHLAGLLMWMPGGLVHLVVASVLFIRWLHRDEANAERSLSRLAAAAVVILAVTVAGCDEKPAPRLVPGGDADRGKQQIEAYGCGSCHVIPGIARAGGQVGPPLSAFAARSYVAGRLANVPENLVRWIREPQSVDPGNAMPNLGVTEQQARDIAAYLYTLR